ncbi:MAG: hypothetical protein ACHQ6V_07575 [Myxococcota bacterium]
MQALLLGLGLLAGLWPALAEWATHIANEPATAYALVFPLLLLTAARSTPPTAPDRSAGLLWIAAAALIEVIAFQGGIERFGRLAIPLGIIGYLRFTGAAALAPAALAFFIVPIPHALAALAPLETVWLAFAQFLLGPVGPALRLDAWDSGLRLVALFAGLGWYFDARSGSSWRGALRRGAQLAMIGLPAQLAAMIVAVALTRSGAASEARVLLTPGVWIVCAAGCVAAFELARKREVPARV